jgi:hypothetical protein
MPHANIEAFQNLGKQTFFSFFRKPKQREEPHSSPVMVSSSSYLNISRDLPSFSARFCHHC